MHSGIEYFSLTPAGRQSIRLYRRDKRDFEADVLDYIERLGAASVDQIAYAVRKDHGMVEARLKTFIEDRLVKRQTRPASPI